MMGLRFFSRASDGNLVLVSYHPRRSSTWYWSVALSHKPFHDIAWASVTPAEYRKGQWHNYYRLPFGRTLIISRQDYHLERGA